MDNHVTNLLDTSIKSDFDQLIANYIPQIFPALSICVIYRGDVVCNQSWGWISPEQQDYPITTSTIFDLASITKLFVETAFLTFVNEGKVGLDSPLVDIIPEFGFMSPRKISGGQDPHTREHLAVDEQFKGKTVDPRQVTFKHLLTHTSGLPPWRDVFNEANPEPPRPPQHKQSIDESRWKQGLKAMCYYPFVGTIGDTVRYSDIGIMLLGEAVARLHGTRLDQAVYDRICKPLGLTSVTYNPLQNGISLNNIVPTEIDRLWRNRRAWGEVHDENACGLGGIAGHAGLFANAYDVAHFGQAWLSGDERLSLSDDLRQQATRLHAEGQFRMGLGWMLKAKTGSSAGDRYSASTYGHTGFTGTSLWIDPDQEIVTCILTNRVYAGREQAGIHNFRRHAHDLIVQGIQEL